jgi:hypothetical protein
MIEGFLCERERLPPEVREQRMGSMNEKDVE